MLTFEVTHSHALEKSKNFRVLNVLILVGTCLGFMLSPYLPQWVAWEHGVFESAQNVILLMGCGMAMVAARRLRFSSSQALCVIAALFWLVFFGREVSWGAIFMPPTGESLWGPSWSSKHLVYRPVVPYVVGALALFAAYVFVRYKVWGQVVMRMVRDRTFPSLALTQFVFCMVVSTNAEGHGWLQLQNWYGFNVMVLEEWVELCGYLALLLAQSMVIQNALLQWEKQMA